ncbi:polysaccharide pyruvyl transferase family protein [Clostridium diolis]|uniref:Polysaccharide pyruvyl transferase domain-containing protein n=1 Tax=Clostridium diolis TaxID=223919 RepID=A0AAV3VWX9_9CLOT|nr:polysaccharide pyruvyl transferase family protein [Clostridium diolis]QES72334.1 polysaccharide pyruvyl transferase family protein [Clostridium diolis]GEA30038.1 hypothetical protein CDIOL_09610 [Clostridium diolis]
MKKIGIITYHSAYNYGSALQAYATQEMVKKICGYAELINFRMKEQRQFYSLYRTKYGMKTLIKDIMQFPLHGKRRIRCNAFENFFNQYMNLSNECQTPDDVVNIWNKYDTIISGSDQIWNKHSQELEHNSWEYMNSYLLVGFSGKKVSYASSVANMTDDELKRIIPEISKFSSISMRENSSSVHMAEMMGRNIENVLDPTFLLDKADWIKSLNLKENKKKRYILYYSLGGIQPLKKNRKVLIELANSRQCKLIIVTPFAFIPIQNKVVETHSEFGPVEFLEAIYNAEMVVTDSYHGTILSVNFEKDVYSLCENVGSEFRKTDILNRIGLNDRIIYDVDSLITKTFEPIDYGYVNCEVERLRKHSKEYLKEAIVY